MPTLSNYTTTSSSRWPDRIAGSINRYLAVMCTLPSSPALSTFCSRLFYQVPVSATFAARYPERLLTSPVRGAVPYCRAQMWIAIKRTTVGTFSVHGSSGKLAVCLCSMRYIWSRERVCNVRHFPCYTPLREGDR